jgi:hypothetical protein
VQEVFANFDVSDESCRPSPAEPRRRADTSPW